MNVEKWFEIALFVLHVLFVVVDICLHLRNGKKLKGLCSECREPLYENEEHKCSELRKKLLADFGTRLDALDYSALTTICDVAENRRKIKLGEVQDGN